MALPKRDYFYLKEVADKLEITKFDLQDYISQGFLSACVYLTANDIKSKDSELYYLDGTLFQDERYFYLHPDSCREIFASGFISERRFYLKFLQDYLIVTENKPAILVREKSLMISELELKCFIRLYEVNGEEKKALNRPGRPSVMTEVLAEYKRRVKKGETYKHKAHEAFALHNWARLNIKDKPVPGANTIRGWLAEPKDKPANAA